MFIDKQVTVFEAKSIDTFIQTDHFSLRVKLAKKGEYWWCMTFMQTKIQTWYGH